MASAQPASLDSLIISKQLLHHEDVVGSLDRGCSLTKLMYKKPVANSEDKVSLQMAFFANKDFAAALQWLAVKLKEEACAGSVFRVSGVGGEKFRDQVADATGLKVEFVDEFAAHTTGAQLLISNFDDDDFCFPDMTLKAEDMREIPEWIERLKERFAARFQENIGKRLPAIFVTCGSGSGFTVIHEDGSLELMGPSMFAGRSLLGLSQLLLGTNSYDEIMSLAAKGDRGNVDTQAWEVLQLGEGAHFGSAPPDMSVFPLGKAADGKSDFAKEDLAAAVIGTLLTTMMPQVMAYTSMKKVPRVYFGGHLFRSEVMRKQFNSFYTTNLGAMGVLQFRFLSTGHTGCLGAMLVSPEEAQQKRANMKFD